MLATSIAGAAPVAVRFPESPSHGFLFLRSHGGDTLADGEIVQVVRGQRVESRLIFRFKDGSLFDETVTFSQQRVFRLLSYRLVQRGRAFPETSEITFSRETKRYTARVGDKEAGRASGTLDLPNDLHNGMTGMLVKNLPPGATASGHLVAFTPKPQLLDTTLRPEGEDRYLVGDTAGTATRYLVKLEIAGLKGVLADLLGKTPPEGRYWFSKGPAPGFMKFEGAMFLNGPKWRIELGAPRWAP
jgi:hypothetical protein